MSRVTRCSRSPTALPQKSSFIEFGFASRCEAWLCPAVSELRFDFGLRPQAFELQTHRGRSPKPIIARTRQGGAMPHNSWQSRIKATWSLEAKRTQQSFLVEQVSIR